MEHLPRGHTADDAAPSTARPSSETVRATAAAPTAGQPRATGDVQRRGPHESSLPAGRDGDSLIGRVVGDVLIQEWIASGGMGHVYRGLQRTPQRPVAVKFLRHGQGPRATQRFCREVEVLGRLSHPHIAALFHAGEFPHAAAVLPYFVMEFVLDAEPLVAFCNRRNLPPQERLRLLLAACDAVAAGHAQGIVHRDLKPANILVSGAAAASPRSTKPEAGCVKVIDFGIAHMLSEEHADDTGTTGSRSHEGTRPYMSPEQFGDPDSTIDARSDVYSLGIVLHELLTGRLPYAILGQPFAEAARLAQQAAAKPLRLPSRSPSRLFRRDLQHIADRCLAKHPSDRYATPGELATDLRTLLAGEPLSPRRQLRTARGLCGWLRRYPLHCGGVALAVGFGGILTGSWLSRGGNRERPAVVAAPQRVVGRSLLNWVGVSPDYPHASHASGADPAIIPERIAPLEWIKLRFDEPLTAGILERSLSSADVLLSRNGVPLDTAGIALGFDHGNLYSCRIEGLEPLTTTRGRYSLAIREPAAPSGFARDSRRSRAFTPLYTWSMPDFARFRFNLHDESWDDHVVSMTGLEPHTDESSAHHATYLRPTAIEDEGVVVMKFPVAFPIHTAWLRARLSVWTAIAKPFATRGDRFLREAPEHAPIDPAAVVTLEVASDGVHWIPVAQLGYGHAGVSFNPNDVSRLLKGSREAWVRARLQGGRTWKDEGLVFTQFLRTEADGSGPAFELDLTGPPAASADPQEPSTSASTSSET